jgi:Ca2+-binding RTX toxin-like protein
MKPITGGLIAAFVLLLGAPAGAWADCDMDIGCPVDPEMLGSWGSTVTSDRSVFRLDAEPGRDNVVHVTRTDVGITVTDSTGILASVGCVSIRLTTAVCLDAPRIEVYAGDGDDSVSVGPHARNPNVVSILGGAGDDWLSVGDVVLGSSGGGADGHEGNDTIRGGSGYLSLYGWEGNDTIYGGSDQDFVVGGAGNDNLTGGGGWDFIGNSLDETGDDVINAADGIGDSISCGPNTDVAFVDVSERSIRDCETLTRP